MNEYEKGLTWRSIIALFFAVLLLEPAIIYYYLVMGEIMPLSVWIILLLWVELSGIFGLRLRKQEIFIIMTFEWIGLWTSTWFAVDLIKRLYFANSEIAIMLGVSKLVPPFYAPVGSDALRVIQLRTFLDPAWATPLLVLAFSVILSAVANLSLGLFAYNLYGVTYKLEFPWASSQATVIDVIAEKRSAELRIFLLAIVAGLLYCFLVDIIPYMLGVILPTRQPVDLTPIADSVFPGALLLIPTDLSQYVLGLILPVEVTLAQLVGMAAAYIVGNHIITLKDLWPLEAKWRPGFSWLWIYQKSQIYFWLSVAIGLGIASAVAPMIFRYKNLLKAFKLMKGVSGGAKGSFYLLMYLIASTASVIMVYIFVPGFPLWILLLLVVAWSFIVTMLQTYAAGVTIGFDVPYLKEIVIYFSGYRDPKAFFAPIQVYTGGSTVAQHLKMAEILKCRLSDYIKAYFLVITLGFIMSFFYVSLLWSVAPIPSSAYPYTVTGWPVEAIEFWRFQKWLWTGYLFREQNILAGLVAGTAIYLVSDFILHKAWIPVVLVTGIIQPPSFIIAQFIGSLVGNYFIAKHFRENWSKVSAYMVMGFLVGDTSLRLLLTVVKLVSKSIWLLPY